MSRTYKDQKPNLVARFVRKKCQKRRLKRKYIRYQCCGAENCRNEYEFNEVLDGDVCPKCGSPTHFETYYLACVDCGWVDYGEDAIHQPDEMAA